MISLYIFVLLCVWSICGVFIYFGLSYLATEGPITLIFVLFGVIVGYINSKKTIIAIKECILDKKTRQMGIDTCGIVLNIKNNNIYFAYWQHGEKQTVDNVRVCVEEQNFITDYATPGTLVRIKYIEKTAVITDIIYESNFYDDTLTNLNKVFEEIKDKH